MPFVLSVSYLCPHWGDPPSLFVQLTIIIDRLKSMWIPEFRTVTTMKDEKRNILWRRILELKFYLNWLTIGLFFRSLGSRYVTSVLLMEAFFQLATHRKSTLVVTECLLAGVGKHSFSGSEYNRFYSTCQYSVKRNLLIFSPFSPIVELRKSVGEKPSRGFILTLEKEPLTSCYICRTGDEEKIYIENIKHKRNCFNHYLLQIARLSIWCCKR